MTPFAISRDSCWTQTAWSQALDLDEIQFLSDWNGDAVRGFGVAHVYRGMADVAERTAFLVERGGTVRGAWLYDTGDDPAAGEAANMAKYAAAEAAMTALDQAIQVHGGNGMATEYGLATLWGATRLVRTAPVSREMILNFVSTHTLGLPRSY